VSPDDPDPVEAEAVRVNLHVALFETLPSGDGRQDRQLGAVRDGGSQTV
jgi:hypothetical protein